MARRQHPGKEARRRPCTKVWVRCRQASEGGQLPGLWGPDPPGLGAGSGVAAGAAHVVWGGLPVYLRVHPRRFRCGQCRKVFVERFAGIRPWGRCTEQAEQAFLRELAGRSFRSTAAHLQVGVGVLRRVVLRRVAPQIDLQAAVQDLPELSYSFRHQDMAVTLTVVLPHRQVLTLLPDDRKRTVEAFFRQMPEEVRGRVRAVCLAQAPPQCLAPGPGGRRPLPRHPGSQPQGGRGPADRTGTPPSQNPPPGRSDPQAGSWSAGAVPSTPGRPSCSATTATASPAPTPRASTPRSSSSSALATGSATATCMCERCSWPSFPWLSCSARHTC